MRKIVFTGLFIFMLSCNKDKFQKIEAHTIANKEISGLNLTEVDQFPLYKSCDETAERKLQKLCFESELRNWLSPMLNSLKFNKQAEDTLLLYFSITTKGKLELDSVQAQIDIRKKLDSILNKAPEYYPAQKRGVPVKVSFQLPLILKLN